MDLDYLKKLVAQYPFAAMSEDGLTVITPPCRLTFVNFEKPYARPGSTKPPRYGCSVIVPVFADASILFAAGKKAWATSPAGAGGARPSERGDPFKKQSKAVDKKGKAYAGFDIQSPTGIWFRTETNSPVPLYGFNAGPDGKPEVLDHTKFYSGVRARVKVRAQAYPSVGGGDPGVKFWLLSVQKIADDEKLVSAGDPSSGYEAHAAPPGAAPAQMPGAGFATNGAGPQAPVTQPAGNGVW